MKKNIITILVGLSFFGFSSSLFADENLEKSIERGKVIAEKLCAKCHAVAEDGDSPVKGAPLFREFASKWPLESLSESLAEGIVTGHDKMPEFVFQPNEIDDFLNYLRKIGNE